MRKLIVIEFITLDGIIQAPGESKEDTSEGFKYGGWIGPYFDDATGKGMAGQMKHADLLLGRITFEIFSHYWPEHEREWPGINTVTKYVMSRTRNKSDWKNTRFLKSVSDIKKLKNSKGSDIQVWGSSNLVQTLMKHDLVDEFWLKIFPITLGTGKRLFAEGTIPAAFKLVSSKVTPSGVIFANFKRAGKVKTSDVE